MGERAGAALSKPKMLSIVADLRTEAQRGGVRNTAATRSGEQMPDDARERDQPARARDKAERTASAQPIDDPVPQADRWRRCDIMRRPEREISMEMVMVSHPPMIGSPS